LRREGHSYACDLWSVGILLCVLLVGRTPYAHRPGDSPASVVHQIQSEELKLLGPRWYRVSVNAKDLVTKLLELDPIKRISASEVLTHPWLTNREELPRQHSAMEASEELVHKPPVQTWYKVNNIQSVPIPALGPVTDSQLAVRRQQARMKSKPKTVNIRPPKPDPLQTSGSPVTCTSSFVLKQTKWPSDMSIFPNPITRSSTIHSTDYRASPSNAPLNSMINATNGPSDNGCFFTSATFTLSHPIRSKPFYSPGHGSLQSRVVV
uniref:Protein kinase domain-containing protein n=1 Tax=Echinostoma caproni TaxID=27848 RepID=A0A183A8G2_9TREM